jgi:hypothetical protein
MSNSSSFSHQSDHSEHSGHSDGESTDSVPSTDKLLHHITRQDPNLTPEQIIDKLSEKTKNKLYWKMQQATPSVSNLASNNGEVAAIALHDITDENNLYPHHKKHKRKHWQRIRAMEMELQQNSNQYNNNETEEEEGEEGDYENYRQTNDDDLNNENAIELVDPNNNNQNQPQTLSREMLRSSAP